MQNRRGKSTGFTLVELLVVIAIIALLLSVLMPALGKVRETAKKVICGSSMHQVSVAMLAYSNDFGGQIPPIVVWDPEEGRYAITFSFGMTVAYQDNQGWVASGFGLLAPGLKNSSGAYKWQGGNYLKSANVFYCPSDKVYATQRNNKNEWAFVDSYTKKKVPVDGFGYGTMSYEYLYIPNDWKESLRPGMDKTTWQPLQRWSTAKNPTQRVVFKDQHYFGAQVPIPKFQNPNSYNIRDNPPYHKDGANEMRLGGAVSFIRNFRAPTNRDLSWEYYFKYVDSH